MYLIKHPANFKKSTFTDGKKFFSETLGLNDLFLKLNQIKYFKTQIYYGLKFGDNNITQDLT